MGTRSVIALKTKQGWFGRYVHWDGYPQGVGAGVWHIVQRDGVGQAVKTLITDNKSWSSITASHEKDDSEFRESLTWVSGYGFAHSDQEEDWYITDADNEKGGAEYAYVLSMEGMEIFVVDYDGGISSRGFYQWGGTTPDFVVEAEALFGASA